MVLKRIARKNDYTIGKLYIDGEYFCDTIEDKDRGLIKDMSLEEIKKLKVFGKTAIPTGTYKVEMTYSPRFKKILPLIVGVKGFEGIRIHQGNTADDSSGCIIVGQNKIVGKVINSATTLKKLLDKIDGEITIE